MHIPTIHAHSYNSYNSYNSAIIPKITFSNNRDLICRKSVYRKPARRKSVYRKPVFRKPVRRKSVRRKSIRPVLIARARDTDKSPGICMDPGLLKFYYFFILNTR